MSSTISKNKPSILDLNMAHKEHLDELSEKLGVSCIIAPATGGMAYSIEEMQNRLTPSVIEYINNKLQIKLTFCFVDIEENPLTCECGTKYLAINFDFLQDKFKQHFESEFEEFYNNN